MADTGKRELYRRWFQDSDGETLTDQQLLEALLGVCHVKNAGELAKRLMAHYSTVWNVLTSKLSELTSIQGVGEKSAILINAVGNIYIRAEARQESQSAVTCPERAAELLIPRFRDMDAEAVRAIYLDGFLLPLSVELICTGSAISAKLDIFPLLCKAADTECADIIIAHNHPTSDPAPSDTDLAVTSVLRRRLNSIGIRLLDHIIVSKETYVSLAAEGYLDTVDPSGSYITTALREES